MDERRVADDRHARFRRLGVFDTLAEAAAV
jgi:hypothetical protein